MTDLIKMCELANGADGCYIPSSRFKTARISVTAYLPLCEENIAAASLMAQLLSNGCRRFPKPLDLSRELDRLYGATLGADTDKMGDTLVWRTGIIFIQDKYLPENIFADCANLLFDTIFNPAADQNGFDSDNFEREKRIQLEDIEGEINDKRTFSRNRCLSAMCEGEPFGIPNLGTAEQVNALSRESVYKLWQKLLRTAYFRIGVIADEEHNEVYGMFAERLNNIERGDIYKPVETKLYKSKDEVKRICDRLDVAQGKLVLGYEVGSAGEDSASYRSMVMIDMLGGGPYSLLFNNVREKLSLCYYCAARGLRRKGILMIDSGVEFDNMDKAETAIGEQIELLCNGDFDDSLLSASKLSLSGALGGVYDSQAMTDRWFCDRHFDKSMLAPEELSALIETVTREDVIAAAKSLRLDTVYRLLAKEGK